MRRQCWLCCAVSGGGAPVSLACSRCAAPGPRCPLPGPCWEPLLPGPGSPCSVCDACPPAGPAPGTSRPSGLCTLCFHPRLSVEGQRGQGQKWRSTEPLAGPSHRAGAGRLQGPLWTSPCRGTSEPRGPGSSYTSLPEPGGLCRSCSQAGTPFPRHSLPPRCSLLRLPRVSWLARGLSSFLPSPDLLAGQRNNSCESKAICKHK